MRTPNLPCERMNFGVKRLHWNSLGFNNGLGLQVDLDSFIILILGPLSPPPKARGSMYQPQTYNRMADVELLVQRQYHDHYCDANCVGGNCCAEFDINATWLRGVILSHPESPFLAACLFGQGHCPSVVISCPRPKWRWKSAFCQLL